MLYLAIATIYSLFGHVYKYMGDQLCAKKILNNHWISGVPILKGLIRILKRLKFCLVNTETTVKIIWSSGIIGQCRMSHARMTTEVVFIFKLCFFSIYFYFILDLYLSNHLKYFEILVGLYNRSTWNVTCRTDSSAFLHFQIIFPDPDFEFISGQ